MAIPGKFDTNGAAFRGGVRSAVTSVFFLVLAGTYTGLGALAHDYGFSSIWLALSSLLVWAAPAQVIIISALGTGATLVETALAVTLSAIRLFPMVVALLPLLRRDDTRTRDLLLPAHFTSVSMWIESLRLLPGVSYERRIAFCNGLSAAYMGTAWSFGFVVILLQYSPSWRELPGRLANWDKLVTLSNNRAVTIYLWHNMLIALAFPIVDLLYRIPFMQSERGTAALDSTYEIWVFALVWPLIGAMILIVGWVEDLGAKRRPRLRPNGVKGRRAEPAGRGRRR